MAGYKRTVFDVDENGTLHMGFLKFITKEGKPFYDCKTVHKDTAKKIYKELGEYYNKDGEA